jgi:hypothetical protein
MIRVILFPNGNTIAFDSDGNQVPELQQSWFALVLERYKELGCDVDDMVFEMPSAHHRFEAKPFMTDEDEFNWFLDQVHP